MDILQQVMDGSPRLGPVRLVAIDGPAGAGKTTLAASLHGAFAEQGVRAEVVHTDDLLDGWDDMITFWPRLEEQVLAPLARGEPARYRRYDWVAGRFADAWIDLPPPEVLLLEGVSSGRSAVRSRLTLGIFVEAPPALRLERGLLRDGLHLRAAFERWMVAEARHFAADGTRQSMDLVIEGG